MTLPHSLSSKSLKLIDDIYAQKYTRSSSFQTLKELPTPSVIAQLFDELRNSELTYKHVLAQLLACCKPSNRNLRVSGLAPKSHYSQYDESPTVTNAVRSLITKHTQLLRLLDQDDFTASFIDWVEDVVGTYESYIRNYKDDIDALDFEKVLVRKPLMRLRYLTKFLETLIKVSAEAGDFAHIDHLSTCFEKVSTLLVNAKLKLESELQDADANSIGFGKVRILERMTPCAAAFSLTDVLKRGRFFVSLKHPIMPIEDMLCEAFLLKNGNGQSDKSGFAASVSFSPDLATGLAICAIEAVGRSLLFPPFRPGELSIMELDGKGITLTPALKEDAEDILLHLEFLEPREAPLWTACFRELFQEKHQDPLPATFKQTGLGLMEPTAELHLPQGLAPENPKNDPADASDEFYFPAAPSSQKLFKNISGVTQPGSIYNGMLSKLSPLGGAASMPSFQSTESPFLDEKSGKIMVKHSPSLSQDLPSPELSPHCEVLPGTRLLSHRDLSSGSLVLPVRQSVASNRVMDCINSSPIHQHTTSSAASFGEVSPGKPGSLNTSPLELSEISSYKTDNRTEDTPQLDGQSTVDSDLVGYDCDEESFSDFEIVTSAALNARAPEPKSMPTVTPKEPSKDYTFGGDYTPSFAPKARDFSSFGKEYKPDFSAEPRKKSIFSVFKKKKEPKPVVKPPQPMAEKPMTPKEIFNKAKESSSPAIQQRKASASTVKEQKSGLGSVDPPFRFAQNNNSSSTLVLSSSSSRNRMNLAVDTNMSAPAYSGPASATSLPSPFAPATFATKKPEDSENVRAVLARCTVLYEAQCRASQWRFNQWQRMGLTDETLVRIVVAEDEAYLCVYETARADNLDPVACMPLSAAYSIFAPSSSLDVECRTRESVERAGQVAVLVRSNSGAESTALVESLETACSGLKRLAFLEETHGDPRMPSSNTDSSISTNGTLESRGSILISANVSSSMSSIPSGMLDVNRWQKPLFGLLQRVGSSDSMRGPYLHNDSGSTVSLPVSGSSRQVLVLSETVVQKHELLLLQNVKVVVYRTTATLSAAEVPNLKHYDAVDASRLSLLAVTGLKLYHLVLGKSADVFAEQDGFSRVGKKSLRVVPCAGNEAFLVVFRSSKDADRVWVLVDSC
ncbi:hypothetical protein BABINDRAFT_159122 [Babjeviella inositovora NRRL Y-12698]|uniref:DH domain-containing protein n=1 Tax=Babjeviella inositovora NRRL Y-12698 TaxID=984486 RepID=A0A1E3QY56_9ASCO|nr:uncharacterized protein BABINDRAFT_159122 [Babjeviella inositovora NRRL Y-12698]ODQ82558.1 hypothetical protein BABINDRAFT_159122 [Babjeviella inositovora NRRL Y-12698]